jgi:hypothetical protein
LQRNNDSKATSDSIAFVPSRSPRESTIRGLSQFSFDENGTVPFDVGATVVLSPQSNRSHGGRRLVHFLPNHYSSAQQPLAENMHLSLSASASIACPAEFFGKQETGKKLAIITCSPGRSMQLQHMQQLAQPRRHSQFARQEQNQYAKASEKIEKPPPTPNFSLGAPCITVHRAKGDWFILRRVNVPLLHSVFCSFNRGANGDESGGNSRSPLDRG